MKTITYIFLVFLALSQGCSPKIRLTRLLEQHPELSVADTVRLQDTVVLPTVKSDTFVNLQKMTDTVVIEKERLSVKLFRKHDTLYVEGKCKPDTIIRELRVPVEKIKLIQSKPKINFICNLCWLITGILIVATIWLLIKRHIK